MAKSMAEEITDKEYTWLVLKWGPKALIKLAHLVQCGASGFTELEYRAATIGQQINDDVQEELSKELLEEIKEQRTKVDIVHLRSLIEKFLNKDD
jgi:hypothetical protein